MTEGKIESKSYEKSLLDVYNILFRHKWKMILFSVIVISIVTVGTLSKPDIFRSEAKLLVRRGRESVTLDPTATTGQVINVPESKESQINSEIEILKSRDIAEKTVDAVGVSTLLGTINAINPTNMTENMDGNTANNQNIFKKAWNILRKSDRSTLLSDYDKAVITVMQNIKVDVPKNSNCIHISYDAKDPKLAQNVLSKLIDVYLEKHIVVHQASGSYQFFIQQANDFKNKLAESESELCDLKDETGISSLEEQRTVVLNVIGELEQKIVTTNADLAASNARVKELQQNLASIPESIVTSEQTGFSDYAADLMRSRLYELQIEQQDLETKYAKDSPPVQKVLQEIAAAEALLEKQKDNPVRAQVTKGVNITYQGIHSNLLTEQANLSSLEATVGNLNHQLILAKAGLTELNEAELKITNLQRELDIQEINYRKYSENLEEARIDQALQIDKISNISIVQPATFPVLPSGPRKSLNILLGLLFATFGSVSLAFLTEYLDHSIKTPNEIEEKLELPAVTFIPRVRDNLVSPVNKNKKDTKLDDKINENEPVKWNIPIRVKEQYEVLRERLLLQSSDSKEEAQAIAVVGCHHSEGTSTIAANLASTFAKHNDGPVLLIDTNMLYPYVHKIFNRTLSPGLSDTLTKSRINKNSIQKSPIHNLHILPAGSVNGNIYEVFDPGKFSKLLKSVKNSYRFIIVDVPATHEISWAVRLTSLCDRTLFVIEAERMRWEIAERVKKELLESNVNIFGAVLNKRRFYIPEWLYNTL